MFRIRRIVDDMLPIDRQELAVVQGILRNQFPGVPEAEIRDLPARLRNPLRSHFHYLLFVADDTQARVRGFAILLHDPDLQLAFLNYLASATAITGSGIGGALYQRVRDEARALRAIGLFFECAPDEEAECATPQDFRANVARMRFYERFGARPLVNNDYRLPVRPGDRGFPFLMFDDLETGRTPSRDAVRKIVRAILERKYAHMCPPEYVDRVVASFRDNPAVLRPPRYLRAQPAAAAARPTPTVDRQIALVVNDRHEIHHVRERGYVEAPVRVRAITQELDASGLFHRVAARHYPDSHIKAVHDRDFVDYLRRCCESTSATTSVYPYVFPIRNTARRPKELAIRAGYYCIDTFTPLHRNAYLAARAAVDCTITAADMILGGQRLGYALVRPPGHHAERRVFGGFCYLNSNAIAAHYFSRHGRVAILDVDYHHGNGQQDIFYERDDVLTISIHGHPRFAYPYFSGFEDEKGAGPGTGANVNCPLPEHLEPATYAKILERALARIARHKPSFLVVALGLDTAKGDPTGTWTLRPADFERNGHLIGRLKLPTLVVQEGGYRTRTLGANARHFFQGLVAGAYSP